MISRGGVIICPPTVPLYLSSRAKVPTCVLRPCGATPEIPNGNVDGCVEKFFGDTCRTTCDDGYNVALRAVVGRVVS